MGIFVSSLIQGMHHMEELSQWINTKPAPDLGVELIAFTHNKDYWKRLIDVLDSIEVPVSFHGPYVGVEATSKPHTKEYDNLIHSYESVFDLAASYKVEHVVFHYTQVGVESGNRKQIQEVCRNNIGQILDLANQYKVNLLIENLPFPAKGEPLMTQGDYESLFDEYPLANSIIDVGHVNITGFDLKHFLENYGNRVKAYHFHNNDGIKDQHNRITDGTFSFENFAPLYHKYTPKCNVVLEYEPHTRLSQEELLADIRSLRNNYDIV